jgi:hypothetical protein
MQVHIVIFLYYGVLVLAKVVVESGHIAVV